MDSFGMPTTSPLTPGNQSCDLMAVVNGHYSCVPERAEALKSMQRIYLNVLGFY